MRRRPHPTLPACHGNIRILQPADHQMALHARFPEAHNAGAGGRRPLDQRLEPQLPHAFVDLVCPRLYRRPRLFNAHFQ